MSAVPPLYRLALAWNLFWGVPALVAPAAALSLFGLPGPVTGIGELQARGLGLCIVLMGFVYREAGRARGPRPNLLLLSAAAKIAAFALCLALLVGHRELWTIFLVFCGDLAFGILFLRDYLRRA